MLLCQESIVQRYVESEQVRNKCHTKHVVAQLISCDSDTCFQEKFLFIGKLPNVFLHISAKVDTFAEQLQANTQRYQSVFCAYIMYVRVGASRARGFQKIRKPSI